MNKLGFWNRLCLIGVAAFGLRLLNAWLVTRDLGSAQIHDAAYYHDVALAMLGRQVMPGLDGQVAFANLGYPYFLKWIYLVQPSPGAVLVLQALLGGLTVVLTGAVACSLFSSELVGLCAAGIYAFYAPAIFYDGLLLTPSLSAFLSVLLTWALCRAIGRCSWRWSALAGVAIGAAALLRATQLLLLPLALVTLYRLRAKHLPQLHRRQLLALLVATLCCVVPAIVQQRIAAGEWIPLTSNGGMNFWIGNHRGASGKYSNAAFLGASKGGDFRHTIVIERDRFLAEARRRSNSPDLTLPGASRFWWRETFREMAKDPKAWLKSESQKLRLSVNNYESRTNASFGFFEEISPLLRWNPLRFGVLLTLAALGATGLGRRRHYRARWILATVTVVPWLTCLTFFVSGEYRHPATPALAALAAFGLVQLKRAVASRTPFPVSRAWPRGVLVSSVCVLAFAPVEQLGLAKDRKAYAETLAMPNSDGSPPTLDRCARARRLLSRHGTSAQDQLLSNEALLLVESNQAIQFRDPAAAMRLTQVTRKLWHQKLGPNAGLEAASVERIRRNLVRRVVQLCRQPFVKQWPDIKQELDFLGCHSWREAMLLLNRGSLEQARDFLQRAKEFAPNSVHVLAYLGQLALKQNKDAAPLLRESLEGYPKIAHPALLMAQSALTHGDVAQAQHYAEEAVNREPTNRIAQTLAASLAQLTRTLTTNQSRTLTARHARLLVRYGMPELGILLLQVAIRRGPYDETLHYVLGNMMLTHTLPKLVLDFFSREALQDKKPQTSHYFMAVALRKLGNPERAIAELRRALEIDPAHEMSQREWGLILEQQAQLIPALEHLIEATRIHPEYRAALQDVARLSERLGRHTEAARWRQRARSADPKTPRRFVYWARYLHKRQRDSAALAEVARRLEVDPTDADALALLSEIRRALALQETAGKRQPGESLAVTELSP